MDASWTSERATEYIEYMDSSTGALCYESIAFDESGDNEQHWEAQDGQTELPGYAAWQNHDEAAEVEAQSLALDVTEAVHSAAEEAEEAEDHQQEQEVLDEVADSSLSAMMQNMAYEEEDQDEMVDSSLSAAMQNMASEEEPEEEQDEEMDGSLSAAMQTMASEDQDEVVESSLSATMQNMASEDEDEVADSSLSAALQNMASEENEEQEVLNEPAESMDIEASLISPQNIAPATDDSDAKEEDASHEQDADKSEDGVPACKRRRIDEQGQAVDGASEPRPVLCRLRSQVFREDGTAGSAGSGLPSEQEGQTELPGVTGKSQRLVAPFKRFFSWLQSSWASRKRPRTEPAAESQQGSESQVDSVAKPMEDSQRRQSVSGQAAAFGA